MSVKFAVITCFLVTATQALRGQSNDIWTAISDSNNRAIGFKDNNGIVRIEPKFTGITIAERFENIIAVGEEDDSIMKTFLGKDGQYYSFVDYRKEFIHWLTSDVLKNFTEARLLDVTSDSVVCWTEASRWIREPEKKFISENFQILKLRLVQIESLGGDYYLIFDGLNSFVIAPSSHPAYFNNCGEARAWQFPVANVVINHRINGHLTQDHFDFLRTENGYKLIAAAIRNTSK